MVAWNSESTEFARTLRQKENDAEAKLWSALRNRRLHNYKFVREFPIGPYFADFACRRRKLVVESDGSQHVGSEHDRVRDDFLNDNGWSVLRVRSSDVISDLCSVLELILNVLEKRHWLPEENSEWVFRPAGRVK